MTVSSSTATASYTGNGSTQIFTVPFYFLVDGDVEVSQKVAATGVISVLTLGTDYTLSGAGNQAGGSATLVTAPATGDQVFIERNVSAVQETAYPVNGPFPAASHEKALDRLTMLVQQIFAALGLKLGRGPLDSAYDAGGNRLTNVADAVGPSDAASLQQVTQAVAAAQISPAVPSADIALKSVLAQATGAGSVGYLTGTVESFLDSLATSVGATLVKFTASATGAIMRTLADYVTDEINSAWFGPDLTGATDCSPALQKALDAAAGKKLRIKPGTYLLGSTLLVSSNTTIEAYGCTFYRIGALDNLLRNKADGTTGGYAANGGITILGGTWDSINGAGAPSNVCTVMAFGHCNNVKVIGAAFANENAWHHIEINSTSNATVRDCSFSGGYASASQFNEAIQIDSMDTSTQFPWFGPYDGTACDNIKVINNRFQDIGSGVGNHTDPAVSNHSEILIDGNLFTNVYYACVKPLGCSSLRVVNNRGESIALGVYVQSGARVANDVTISNNTWYHIGYGTYTGDSRAVKVLGNATGYCKNLVISGNKVLDVRGTAGTHGISADMAQLVTISGNTVEDTNRSGIYVFGGKYVTTIGNVVRLENGAALGYEGIRLGTGTLADSDRFNVEGNYCSLLGSYALNNSMIRNNNIATNAVHSGNTATNTLDNLVGTTFTAG